MKKLFLSSVVLIAFAISMFLFQFSCKKDASATTSSNPSLGIILYAVGNNSGVGYEGFGSYSAKSYWTMNYDGTNPKQIPLTFSANLAYSMIPRLSVDGKTIFFTVNDISGNRSILYSCLIDGSNLKTLLTVPGPVSGAGGDIEIGGIY